MQYEKLDLQSLAPDLVRRNYLAVQSHVNQFRARTGRAPHLHLVEYGVRSNSNVRYAQALKRAGSKHNILVSDELADRGHAVVGADQAIAQIEAAYNYPSIDAVLVLQDRNGLPPVARAIHDARYGEIVAALGPRTIPDLRAPLLKDVEGLNAASRDVVCFGQKLAPGTARATADLIEYWCHVAPHHEKSDVKIGILGRSPTVGLAIRDLLRADEYGSVAMYGSNELDQRRFNQERNRLDILVAATDQPRHIDSSKVGSARLIIDLGHVMIDENTFVGNVDLESVPYVRSRVVTNIGKLTTSVTLDNTVHLALHNHPL